MSHAAPDPKINPSVTVVVPMFNDEATIGQQLEALAGQDYAGPWEVIVADNGSTDRSVEQANRHARRFEHFRVVDASGSRGASFARNAGARAGRGEALLFTDADDVVRPGWIAALVDALHDSDLAGGPADELEINPPFAREWGDPPVPTDRLNIVFNYLPNARGNNVAIWRRVLDALGGWNEGYRFAEDIELSWRALNAGYRLAFAPDAVVQYRRRHTIPGLVRQQFFRGRQAHRVQLARDFGRHGLRLESDSAQVRRSLKWIGANSPSAFRDRATRGSIAGTIAYGVGWVAGAADRRKLRRASPGEPPSL